MLNETVSEDVRLDVVTLFPTIENSTVKLHVIEGDSNHVLLLILLPLTAIACVVVGIGFTAWLLKRNRAMRLRHHLMPLYNFDPSDSGGDWETDLLGQEVKLRADSEIQPSSALLNVSTMYSQL